MDISADIAATATAYKSTQVQSSASMAVMKKTMDAQTSIAMQLVDMLSLDVGAQQPQALNIEV